MTQTRHGRRRTLAESRTRAQALRALIGDRSVLYALRLDDGVIKIGCTKNLQMRRNHFGDAEIIGFAFGDFEDEKALHKALVPHRHHAHEYYNPAPEVMAVVNDWREPFGLPPF